MEATIYEVIAEREEINWDIDVVPYVDTVRFFTDIYSTKVSAIRIAQRIHSKNKRTWVRVEKSVITEKGRQKGGIVYRKLFEGRHLDAWEE